MFMIVLKVTIMCLHVTLDYGLWISTETMFEESCAVVIVETHGSSAKTILFSLSLEVIQELIF